MMQSGGVQGEASLPEVFIYYYLSHSWNYWNLLFVGHFHDFLGCERTNSAPHCPFFSNY